MQHSGFGGGAPFAAPIVDTSDPSVLFRKWKGLGVSISPKERFRGELGKIAGDGKDGGMPGD